MSNNTDRLLRKSELRRVTSLPTTTQERLEAAGQFPKRIKVGPRAVAWLESEVQAWIRARAEDRGRVHGALTAIGAESSNAR